MKINNIDILGQFADLKNNDYKNLLAITVIIEILIEKGLFTREDFSAKAQQLDDELEESATSKSDYKKRNSLLHIVPRQQST